MSKRDGRVLRWIEIIAVSTGFLIISILVFRAWSISHSETAQIGVNAGAGLSLPDVQIFPPGDPWNTDISNVPVDENSNALIASIGMDAPLHPDFGTTHGGVPNGIPYAVVSADQEKVPVTFRYAAESDPGPYPIPTDVPIEANGDRHVILLDKTNQVLYELYAVIPEDGGKRWRADTGAIFDLTRSSVQRPLGWSSADTAGLPIFPGLVRYDEVVEKGRIQHALRFTTRQTRRAFVYPATRYASRDENPDLPPMGMRVRLKLDYDISAFPSSARVVLQCLKTYGMIVADHGGDWFISGAPDPRWNDEEIRSLKKVKGSAFEVVRMGEIRTTLKSSDSPARQLPGTE